MKMKCALGLLLVVIGTNISYSAESVSEISWPDLIPVVPDFDDPFQKLNSSQLYDLSVIAGYRERLAKGETLSSGSEDIYQEAVASLVSEHIDIDGLLAKRQEIAQQRRVASEAVDSTLDNHPVRIPGYLLPLDFSNDMVTEFLLVPTVGACIHVPPPPPNQMVYVKYPKGFAAQSLYPPVWVEGKLSVGKGESSLYLSDGADTVTFGYSIEATIVEDYERR
ncbi:DUF3299 domain-containing protein [Vibrio vulnificus]|uniref:DUF3299 domain-containing protein n=1 Tax=Vibrio vulnificus TaxID=672 RepID=UPI00102A5462|nr:DUF3299 domain-containing protein [Vibrio vulnificus]RZP60515.1 DUF3299 domain-containing protein [Vibrio vulnificus]